MTVNDGNNDSSSSDASSSGYVPNLAEFYFEPTYDWTVDEARNLYQQKAEEIPSDICDRIHYQDCVKAMSKLPDGCTDLVIADPPFGIEFDGKSSVYNRNQEHVVDGYEEINGSYMDFTRHWMAEIPRLLKKHGSAYVFSGWSNLESILRGGRLAGLSILNHVIWKYPFGVFTRKKFVTSHYHVLLFVKYPQSYFFNKIQHYPLDVWNMNRQYRAGCAKNGTRLPLEVVMRCVDYSSRPGDLVLDPFMGNGTTAAACKTGYRHYLGYEINDELQPIIQSELSRRDLGELYKPYKDRLPSIEELAEKYPKAYEVYAQRENQNTNKRYEGGHSGTD
ncbi:MAG: site-specific DNA-methyltransferase [Candidatus Thorarchaeota archaeon]